MGLEYRFKRLEYNGLKGTIGEHLARSFIRGNLAPKLMREEGWSHVMLSNNDYKHHAWTWNTKLFDFDNFRQDFILHGFYPTMTLLSKYTSAVGILNQNHCTPDGLLLKFRETGKMKRVKKSDLPSGARMRVEKRRKHGDLFEFPTVEGDLEIVEIKCGRKAKLMGKQKEAYNALIAKDVPLRMIKVRIVSFDLNRFLVEEHKYEKFL
ncbi:MAG: hypothetical protein JSV57_00945 [Candidatus Bathyarchaeota archaeon]|nr:MAG: hypothetical protein JSV57_00945 [Candidatus Bathyarchaeota archaeon]